MLIEDNITNELCSHLNFDVLAKPTSASGLLVCRYDWKVFLCRSLGFGAVALQVAGSADWWHVDVPAGESAEQPCSFATCFATADSAGC